MSPQIAVDPVDVRRAAFAICSGEGVFINAYQQAAEDVSVAVTQGGTVDDATLARFLNACRHAIRDNELTESQRQSAARVYEAIDAVFDGVCR